MQSSNGPKAFRELLSSGELILSPGIYDPLSARVAEVLGFKAISLGGFAAGAHLCTTEPLTTLTEMVDLTRSITSACSIPLIVDAGAGYGEPIHVMRTVKQFGEAGAAGIHIEDQVFPKRVHYHRDYKEHVIDSDEMVDKIRYALAARTDSDFVIIARTDSLKTGGLEEGIRRANLYAEAGADMVMAFPNNVDEAKELPKRIKAPLIYVNSPGNRVGRPLFTVDKVREMGYKMLSDATSVILAAAKSAKETLSNYLQNGEPPFETSKYVDLRLELENAYLSLPSYYSIEEKTTEKGNRP